MNMKPLKSTEVFHQIRHPMPIRLKDVDKLAAEMAVHLDLNHSEAMEYVGNSGIAKFETFSVERDKFMGTIFVVVSDDGKTWTVRIGYDASVAIIGSE